VIGSRFSIRPDQLSISTGTIEIHRASVMRKLQIQTRAQLVNYALANGLIGSG
jgi:DNA-binding CsgD family transcriptional regulator